MHLIAETAPRVTIVRELGCKHHLADGLVGIIWLSVVPQIEEVVAQGVCSKHFLTILYDSIKVRRLVAAVPLIISL